MDLTEDERKEYDAWKATKNNITQIEVQAEKVEPLPKKQPKPRTEKQLEATKRMRDALLTRRKEHNEKKTEHSDMYKQKMDEAFQKAEQIKEINPRAKVVVKSSVGRPKGVKNKPTDPTPAQSESEEEEEPKLPNKIQPKIPKPISIPKQNRISNVEEYLRRLNGSH